MIPLQQSMDNQLTSLLQTTNLPQMYRKLSRCRQPHYNCTARVPRAHRRGTAGAPQTQTTQTQTTTTSTTTTDTLQTHCRHTADAPQMHRRCRQQQPPQYTTP